MYRAQRPAAGFQSPCPAIQRMIEFRSVQLEACRVQAGQCHVGFSRWSVASRKVLGSLC